MAATYLRTLGVGLCQGLRHHPSSRGDFVTTPHHSAPPDRPVRSFLRAGAVALLFGLATLLIVPVSAFGQGTSTQTPIATAATPAPVGTAPAPEASATPRPSASLKLSTSSGLPGATITANGSDFKPGETVEVTFNGQTVGSPTVNAGGSFSMSFN